MQRNENVLKLSPDVGMYIGKDVPRWKIELLCIGCAASGFFGGLILGMWVG